MTVVAASWPVGRPACAIDSPAASDMAKFFGLTVERAAPIPKDRAGVNWSIEASHSGIFGSSPFLGRARHWRSAANNSSSTSTSLMVLTVLSGPLLDD